MELPGERGEDFTLNCLSRYRQGLELIGENSQPLAVSLSQLQSEEPCKALCETARVMHVHLASHIHFQLLGFMDSLGGFTGYTAKGAGL